MAEATDARLAGALRRYRVMAIITGSFLVALTIAVVLKYVIPGTRDAGEAAVSVVGTIHGFIYIVYLLSVGALWIRARWGLGRLAALVLGGVVPGLTFWLERRVTRELTARAEAAA